MPIILALLLFQTSDPLAHTTFEMTRTGLRLEPSKVALLIDENGPPVIFSLGYGGKLDEGMRFRGHLVGPGLSTPYQVDVPADEGRISLERGLFSQEGSYRLMNVRLEKNDQTLAFAEPDVAEIQVAENFLVSEVQVKPLSEQDLIDRGYLFSEEDYFSVEFELALTIGSQEETIKVPVAYPKKATESFQPVVLEDPFTPYVRMLAFKHIPDGGMLPGYLDDPPAIQNYVPGLILIPGNFNYLKSHFEVTCLVLNAAPDGFDVRVDQLSAQLHLPEPGVYGTPLTVKESVRKPMAFPGADEILGTDDDRSIIHPGEKAQANYVVIGNIPGMYDVEIAVEGLMNLQGESIPVATLAKGQIFVRSPEFSADFEHPDAVAQDESYDLHLTITNRGEIPLEGFSVTLDPDNLVGVTLNNHPVQSPGSIPVGGQATVTWNLTALISGQVVSSYFKIQGDGPGALHLRTGVGELGQRHSPFVLNFPAVFYQEFGSDLGNELRRFAKVALDFSQMRRDELPDGLLPISPTSVREFNTLITGVAKSSDFGVDDRNQLIRLYELWNRSVVDYTPMDLVRRLMISNGTGDMEGAFSRAFQATFNGASPNTLLSEIGREVETASNLFALIVETEDPAEIRLDQANYEDLENSRGIPFSSRISLGTNKTLIWSSGGAESPVLTVTPAGEATKVAVTALFPTQVSARHLLASATDIPSGSRLRVDFDPAVAAMRLLPGEAAPQTLRGVEVTPKPFELLLVRQAEPKIADGSDIYGRDFIFSFSKTLDLASLNPIEEHLFINGEPAVDAVLQSDGRTLIAGSRMPLGPYHPISYSLRAPRARDGQALLDQNGSIQGSSWYTGVSISGRVVDRNGSDLSKAVVFHWRHTPDGWLIFDKSSLDENSSYLFEFSPFRPFAEGAAKTRLRVGVLLENGRYEEREFAPQGAGQQLVADFAFLQQGEVRGYVRDDQGNPVPNAVVYAVNQNNDQSAVLTETDLNGYYRAAGLEVGPILVKSSANAIVGYAADYLTQTNSPLNIDVIIDNPSGTITGTIATTDGGTTTPVQGAFVAFLLQNGLAATLKYGNREFPYTTLTQTGADGRFILPDAPAGNGFFWVFDPHYGYFERLITLENGEMVQLDHTFDNTPAPTGTVTGTVRNRNGAVVEGAVVSAEGKRTTSNAVGFYELPFLTRDKTHTISATHPDYGRGTAGIDLDRERLEGIDLQLRSAINISGRYEEVDGTPIPFTFIYQPPYGAVFKPLAQTDANGHWSATLPEPGIYAITTMDTPKIAAIPELTVTEDGVSNLVLRQWPTTSLRVRLLDENGAPVVAKVDLKSMKPSPFTLSFGIPILVDTHLNFFTDANGEKVFENINIGDFEVFGHSGQLGETEVHTGTLVETPQGGEPLTVTLVFPGTLDPANLFGQVFAIDGVSPAPEGTIVQVKGPDIDASVFVDALGQYRFETLVETSNPVRLNVIAAHPTLGIYDTAWFDLHQDLNFRYDLSLKREGTAHVRIINGDGTPADFAAVQISYRDVAYVPPVGDDIFGIFKPVPVTEERQITPDQQVLTFTGIPQGAFTVRANTGNGLVGLRAFVIPTEDRELDVTVQLEAASRISGMFLNHQDTPIGDAEIQLLQGSRLLQQRLSDGTPGMEGNFLFDSLPMRDYRLYGVDPSNAFEARLDVTTSPYIPEPFVTLRLDPIGHLEGVVYFNGQPVINAQIELIRGSTKIITGSDAAGVYRFRNLPLGNYSIKAQSPAVFGKINTGVTLSEAFATKNFDLNFGEIRNVDLYVAGSDGTPANGVLVTVENLDYKQVVGNSAYTGADGVAVLTDLPLGTYRVSGQHPVEVVHLDGRFTITEADRDPIQRNVAFQGYGSVAGLVTDTTGAPLSQPVHINVRYIVNYSRIDTTITTDATGAWRLGRLPVDTDIKVTAYNQETQEVASAQVRLDFHGQELEQNLTFRTSTYVSGTVRYADGTPAVGAEVWVTEPYYVKVISDGLGEFFLQPILEGQTTLFAKDANSERKAALPIQVDVVGGLPTPISNLDVNLSGVAEVSGIVTYSDGTILRSGSVTLTIPELEADQSTVIFGDGSYRFDQVPLGSYEIVAHDRTFAKDTPIFVSGADSDGQRITQNLVFEASYQLTGRMTANDGITAVQDGLVELWRPREDRPDTYDLIYAGRTNDQGYYVIDHIYPGAYRIKGEDPDLEGFYESDHLMQSQNMNRDIQLVSRSWLLGTITDADGNPFTSGEVFLTQNGRTYFDRLNIDGSFRIEDLAPGPYLVNYTLANGWISGTVNGVLGAGASSLPITTGATATLTGRAILIREPAARPSISFALGHQIRSTPLNASGDYVLGPVPVGADLQVNLSYGGLRRVETIHVDGDMDLGTLYLDAIAPLISFADDGGSFDSLPYDLNFGIVEEDLQSSLNQNAVRVWVNGTEITQLFTPNAGGIGASLESLPTGFVLGWNNLRVEAANEAGALSREDFTLEVALSGVTLVVDVKSGQAATTGQVRLGEGDWANTDATGRIVFDGVLPGSYTLKGRNSQGGKRQNYVVSQEVNQQLNLVLAPVGTYTGRVLDLNGDPLAAATVTIGDQRENTDQDGNYTFDLLPLGQHDLLAGADELMGYRLGDNLSSQGQTLGGQDIQLLGTGTVAGFVYDDDGTTVIPDAQVVLHYSGLPDGLEQQTTSAADGSYGFAGVMTRGLRISALQTGSGRGGSAEGTLVGHGGNLALDVLLSPAGNLQAVILDTDNNPVPDLNIHADGPAFDFDVTTDSNGAFSLPAMPYDTYHFSAEWNGRFQYLSMDVTIDSDVLDLGNLNLTLDTAPSISDFALPAVYDLAGQSAVHLALEDDRRINRYRLTYSGAYSSSFDRYIYTTTYDAAINPGLPVTAAEGVVDWTLEVIDHLGQTTSQQGTTTLIWSGGGPLITITQPGNGAILVEGEPLDIQASASDPAGIAGLFATLNGEELGEDSAAPYQWSSHAPGVTQTSTVPLVITATNRRGISNSLTYDLVVNPINSAGGPEITMIAPLPGMPLPLALPGGLALRIAAEASDEDGLESADIRVAGNLVTTVNLSGNTALIEHTYPLPADLRDQSELLVELIVRDQGGNPSISVARVNALELNGEVHIADAAAPLDLRDWDVSLDGKMVVLAGGVHIVDGAHVFSRMVLVNGAQLTQTATDNSSSKPANTSLDLSAEMIVDYGAQISMDQTGYPAMPPGFGYSGWRASHGGLGRYSDDLRLLYGSPFQPRMPGSNNGGGAIKISADSLWLAGTIHADGRNNGQSSGGSVWLKANRYEGRGRISANAFSDAYSSGYAAGGGGGRVAVYGPYQGTAQAYGGIGAGAGTVYYHVLDSSAPKGFRDRLEVINHPEAVSGNLTAIRTLHNRVVGTDLTSEIVTQDNQTRQVLSFLETLPQDSFIGMFAYRDGEIGQFGKIAQQTETSLRSAHLETFSPFLDGESIHVDYQVDQVFVGHQAQLSLDAVPNQPIHVAAGGVLDLGETPLDLSAAGLQLENGAALLGTLLMEDFNLSEGTLFLEGGIVANNTLSVDAGATLRTRPGQSDASFTLEAASMNLAGTLLAANNPGTYNPSGRYDGSHGGMGGALSYASKSSYGSLYLPRENGRTGQAGGSIGLRFDSLTLDGTIEVNGELGGSGGAILLEGRAAGASLVGSGGLMANGSSNTNNYRAGGGGRIAVLVEDTTAFSGSTQALGGIYPATPSDPFHHAGAGTIFYRTAQWPNGRLIVENQGFPNKPASTPLPGLGFHTADSPQSGTTLAGTQLPEMAGLTGLHVAFPGGETRLITGNESDQLTLESEMPALAAGETYHGIHILDVLEIRGNARLQTPDAIRVLSEVVLESGSIDAPDIALPINSNLADGGIELHADPGFSGDMVLDNFHLTAHFPMNLTSLTLINGATLTMDDNLIAAQVTIENGTLALTGNLSADAVVVNDTLILNGSVNAASNFTLAADALVATPETVLDARIELEADVLSLAGTVRARRNPLGDNPANRYTGNHGGYGGGRDQATTLTLGSLYQPSSRGADGNAGGHIRIAFGTSLELNGRLEADGINNGPGGSILLEGNTLSGAGSISANGGDAHSAGGGGRIALLIESPDAFAGQITAYGGFFSNSHPSLNGGAGTIFYKNASSWPNGRLIVDNNGTETLPGSTTLPGLGDQTVSVATGGGTTIEGIEFPAHGGLQGLYAVFAEGEPVRIDGNTVTTLTSEAGPGFPVLAVGDGFSGRHVLDILEIRGKANLRTIDGLHVLVDFVQGQGSVESPDLVAPVDAVLANGSIEYFEDPGFTRLELDNFHLTIHFPLDLTRLVLNNGSTLTTDADLLVETMTVNDGTVVSNAAISADTLTLSDAGTIRTPTDQVDGGLMLDVTDLNIHGTLLAAGNPSSQPSGRPWYDMGHGGHSGYYELEQSTTFGSFYHPRTNGLGATSGGRLHVKFDNLELTGSIDVSGNGRAAGGSIILEGTTLSGDGTVKADGGNDFYAGGGGRVAVLVENLAGFNGPISAYGGLYNNNVVRNNGGAGTVFYKNGTWPNGRLVIDNRDAVNRPGATELPGLGQQVVAGATGGSLISGSDFPILNGLQGMYAVFEDGAEVAIAANTSSEITPVTSFPSLASGDAFHGLHILDVLEIRGQAHLKTADAVRVLQELIVADGSIDCPDLEIPPGFVFSNGAIELFEDPGITDLELDNFQLTVHFPLNLGQLNLSNGATLTSTNEINADSVVIGDARLNLNGRLNAQSLNLAAAGRILTIDGLKNAGLTLDVNQMVLAGEVGAVNNGTTYFNTPWYDMAHGGHSGYYELDQSIPFGSLYEPATNGKGATPGGAVHLIFETLELGGKVHADGSGRSSGGSVRLSGTTISGGGTISADGGNDFYAGGGGRVALHVENLNGFTGPVSASGGLYNATVPRNNGGAGTIYYKNSTWPNGRLVLDNQNVDSRSGTTYLPGLGERVVTAPTGGSTLSGLDFPPLGGLVGSYVVSPDGSEVAVSANNETEISTLGSFPSLVEGDRFSGLHILDVLEIRGKARLRGIDPIRITTSLVVEDGTIDIPNLELPPGFVFSNGEIELFEDPGLAELDLDNFKLTVHFPLQLTTLSLRNGATLTTTADITATDVSLSNSTLVMNGRMDADSLSVDAGSSIQTPDNTANAGIVLHVPTMELNGPVRAHYNPTDYFGTQPWNNMGHGGHSGYYDLSVSFTYGTLYQPQTNGLGADNPGGRIELHFTTLNLNAPLDADGIGRGSGGSVWLKGRTLVGTSPISANGGDDFYAGGGGRVALHVEDLSGYSGAVSAFGGVYNVTVPRNTGGAGTVFYQNTTWPNGRLIVDNNNVPSRTGSTSLPGLGARVAASATGGAAIEGTDYPGPNSLAGMYVLFADDSTVAVSANTTTTLSTDGVFPALNAGDGYSGLHILDVLEIKGQANLTTPDGIRVLESFVLESGSINSPHLEIPSDGTLANGSIELFEDPGYAFLELDNFHLIAHYPIDVDHITLSNGATLISDGGVTVTNQVHIIEGTLSVNGTLNANLLTISPLGILETIPGTSDARLVVNVDQASVAGEIRAQNTTTDNPGNLYRSSHGGYGGAFNFANTLTYGSLYAPMHAGVGSNNEVSAGGALAINFTSMDLNGTINANGLGRRSGGAVHLQGGQLTGNGLIQAHGGDDYYAGGGGRVALWVDEIDGFSGTASAFGGVYSNGTSRANNGGAGTVYYRTTNWPNGRLVIDNNNRPTNLGTTTLPGLGTYTLTGDTDGNILEGTGFPAKGGLRGLYLVLPDNSEVAVLDNTATQITLAAPVTLAAGAQVRSKHRLDVLEVKGQANLRTADGLSILQSFNFDGGTIDTTALQLPEGSMLANGSIELFVDPGLPDLTLNNFQLTTRIPLVLNSLTLESALLSPHGTINADRIEVDATSRISVFDEGNSYNPSNRYRSSHGGFGGAFAFDGYQTLGSLYTPTTNGRGSGTEAGAGGRVHLVFNELILEGTINVDGGGRRAGGSILLEGQTLSGNGPLSANGGDDYYAGGGGRIALKIADVDAFTGGVTAYGGVYSNGTSSYNNGGAGTVFYRTNTWPNGRLLLDNNGRPTRFGSTLLPGLGTLSLDEAVNSNVVPGDNLPALGGLTGLHVVLPGNQEVAVTGNDETSLILAQAVNLNPGDTLSAVHILDVLEVRNGANLSSTDALRVLASFDFDGGTVDSPALTLPEGSVLANGSATFFVDPGLNDLTLDNYQLTIRTAFSVENLTLQNATLQMFAPISADHIEVDALSVIRAASEGNRYNPSNRYRSSHGGFGGAFNKNDYRTLGSFHHPETEGRGSGTEAGAGGLVSLSFNSLNLLGTIDVAGTGRRSGGSVLLQGNRLTGNGFINANGGNDYYAGGGGRIALLVDQIDDFSGVATAYGGVYSTGTSRYNNGGAGTIFYQTNTWPNGRLVVDNNGVPSEFGSTTLPSLGLQTVNENISGNTVPASGLPALNGLRGLHLILPDNSEVPVVANDENQLVLASAVTLSAGQNLEGVHILDVLEVRGGGQLKTNDRLRILQDYVFDDGSVDASDLSLPHGNFTDGSITLFVDPAQADLNLTRFQLDTRGPFNLNSLSLNNAVLRPYDSVQAATISVAADSRITVSAEGNDYNPGNRYRSSHGGYGGAFNNSDYQTLGSFHRPTTNGRGSGTEAGAGGFVHLIFDSLALEGALDVAGSGRRSGGSVLLEGSTITGNGPINANGGNDYYAGGGGRIALLVDDISAYAGAVTAFGGVYSTGTSTYNNGGAGTVFFRTSTWPNGRLVIDNNNITSNFGSTRLPAFATRVLNETVSGTTLPFENLPALDGLTGLHLVLPDGGEVAVGGNDENALTLTSSVNLNAGASLSAVHILDVLEVTGGANLATADHLRILQSFDFNGGSVDAAGLALPNGSTLNNGAATLFVDPGLRDLTLDNFQLTARTELDLDSLTLQNATMTVYEPITAGTISVDAQSVVRARSEGNDYNPGNRFRSSHGGYGGAIDYSTYKTLGSLYRPTTNGRGSSAEAGAGGRIHLTFNSLQLEGHIDSNGSGRLSGGSILLVGDSLSGAGSISADGGNDYYSGGGGRIALHVEDLNSFSGAVTAYGGLYSNGTSSQNNAGAGTVFYRNTTWPNGRLVVDNRGLSTRAGSTVLPGLGERTVAEPMGGDTLFGDNFPALDGLHGLHVAYGETEVAVTSNSESQLQLAGTLPPMAAGETYHGLHILDVVEVRGSAHVTTPDEIRVIGEMILEDGGTLDALVPVTPPPPSKDRPAAVAANATPEAAIVLEARTLDRGETVLHGNLHYQRLSLLPGARVVVVGSLKVETLELWRAELIVRSIPGDKNPGISAGEVRLREAHLGVDQIAVTGDLWIDGSSRLTPSGQQGNSLEVRAGHLHHDGLMAAPGGLILAELGQLSAAGGRIEGRFDCSGGQWLSVALVVEQLDTRGPLFLSESMIYTSKLTAPHLVLARGSQLHPLPDQSRLVIEVDEAVSVDATAIIGADGLAKTEGKHVHGGLDFGFEQPAEIGDLYGSPVFPAKPGLGKGGGGVVHLRCQSLALEGVVSARGTELGAGGSLLITAHELKGRGLLDVQGGATREQFAGGGRVALHVKQTHRFGGRILTGNREETTGTLVLDQGEDEGVLLYGGRDEHGRYSAAVSPVLPRLQIPPEAVLNRASSPDGLVLRIAGGNNLGDAAGLWLQSEQGLHRVLDVVPMETGVFLLSLEGWPDISPHSPLELVLSLREHTPGEPSPDQLKLLRR